MNNKFKLGILLCAAAVMLCSCKKEWLDTKALSFYTPENTYVNADGFYSAISQCEQHIRGIYYGDKAPIVTAIMQSEVCVSGETDKKGPQMNMDTTLLPDNNLNNGDITKVGWFWENGYAGVKYANIVISRIDNCKWSSESERNAILGAGYFHRAYWYYILVNCFGDVPYIDWEINEPKLDFYTYDRWGIIEKECKNLEFAYKWLSDEVDRGRTTKSGCGILLMKYYMMLGRYDEAITVGKEITAKHPLMTERFTSTKASHPNLMFDLHSIEAKLDLTNTEGLFYVMAYPNVSGSTRIQIGRNVGPNWDSYSVVTPNGNKGFAQNCRAVDVDTELDVNHTYTRGQGMCRPTHYYQYDSWGPKERKDLRGIYNKDSWKSILQMKYNNPDLITKYNDPYFGKLAVKPAVVSAEDSLRSWYNWPHFKVFVPDPLQSQWRGGETPWYIYRSAEAYLLMGECYYWKSKAGGSFYAEAAEMLNVVRRRSGAEDLAGTAEEITIDEILKERNRELFYEEIRHAEEVRIAYTFAKYGYPCEFFGGKVYKLDGFSGPGGTGTNVKEYGHNFWWDYVDKWSAIYNRGIFHKWAEYKISVQHVLWPVPAAAITANTKGHINQNIGYPGAENNIPVLEVPMDHTVMGPDAVTE